jgi:outer membrane receptor protein involved in Fe transport
MAHDKRTLFRTSVAAAALMALTAPAVAQTRPATYRLNIPAQDLGGALRAFGKATRQQLVFEERVVAGRRSPSLVGDYSAEEALGVLLSGSNLEVRRAGVDVIAITAGQAGAQLGLVRTAAAGGPPPAPAAPVETVPPPASAEVAEVVVTGSRVATAGFTAPTPVTVIGSAQLQEHAITNVADELNFLPAFRATTTPTPTTTNNFQINGGQNFLDLRGLSAPRTLVLMNGRRVVPSSTTGATNINLIPTIAIARTEVVTGGASAAYGSDAVAGVVNILLDNRYTGYKAEAQGGMTRYSDNKNYKFAAMAGTDFMGGRGHVMVAGEYYKDGGVGDASTRDWGRKRVQLVNNGANATNGYAQRLIIGNVQQAGAYPGGLITSGPLKGITFLGNGQTGTFTYGSPIFQNSMIGGTEFPQTGLGFDLRAPVKRYALLAHLEYDLTDSIQAFSDLSYADTRSHGDSGYNTLTGDSTAGATPLRVDNPYLPADVRARMQQLNLTSVPFGRVSNDLPKSGFSAQNDSLRIVVGLNGAIADFGLGHNWKWDGYYQYGLNKTHNKQINGRIPSLVSLAGDPVTVTAANVGASGLAIGSIACRSTLTAPTNGCVPANFIGPGQVSAAAFDYFSADSLFALTNTQHVAAFNLQGEPFSTWAGPVAIAAGVEARWEKADATSDPLSTANLFNGGNLQPINGESNVKEVYGEVVVPLAKGKPLFDSLEANGAIRYTDYSLSGGVTTWKLGATYQPIPDLRFRATRSRDIRAPNIGELFTRPTRVNTALINPYTRQNQTGTAAFLSGNPNLTPEIAKTWTAGGSYQPSWLRGFRMAVDYYSIEINNVIGQPTTQNIVDTCFIGGLPEYCALFDRDPVTNTLSNIRRPFLNQAQFKTNGWDYEIAYSRPLLGGNLALRALGNYVANLTTVAVQPGGPPVITEVSGMTSGNNNTGVPHWVWNVSANYSWGPWSGTVQARYIQKSRFDNTFIGPNDPSYRTSLQNSINDNTVPAYVLWNLFGQWKVTDKIQVFGAVNNLFDKAPPQSLTLNSYFTFYDVIGRSYRAGVRYNF